MPMLELGSGFDYDLTGKENIYLNGAVLGYSKEFLESRYNDILEFSELGEFINTPIRIIHQVCLMRLAFSIATVVNPEILIVDEILSVGDENFQKKSHARMMELMAEELQFYMYHTIWTRFVKCATVLYGLKTIR